MKFWKWFFGGILYLPRAAISPLGEYILAIALGITAILIVATAFSTYWLLLVIPAFSLMASHGYWRAWVKSN